MPAPHRPSGSAVDDQATDDQVTGAAANRTVNGRGRLSALPTWSRPLLVALLALIGSGLLVGLYVSEQRPLSPFDEWTFVDYLDKAASGGIAEQGELIDEYALEVSSCRGVFVWGPQGSPCGGPYSSEDYVQGGVTSADVHPPTYFFATAALTRPLLWLGVTDDLLTAGRLTGAVWLALGLGLLYLLARELGAARAAAGALAVAVAVSPLVRYSNSYVTPDAVNLAVGAAVLLLTLRFARGRSPLWALALIGAVATAVKAQNVLAVGAAALLLLVEAYTRRRADDLADAGPTGARAVVPSPGRAVAGAAVLVGAAGAAAVGWLVLRGVLSVGESPAQTIAPAALSLDLLLSETTSFVGRLGVGAVEDGQPVALRGELLSYLLIGGAVGTLLVGRCWSRRRRVAGVLVLSLLFASPALLVLQQATAGGVFPSPTRYGMSLLPLYAAVAAAAVRDRAVATGLLAGWSVVAGLVLVSYT